MKDYQLYDKIINSTLINIYTFSKNTEDINLYEFDSNNKAHLCFYEITKIFSSFNNYKPISIDLSFLKFKKFKKKYPFSSLKRFKLTKKKFIASMIDVNEILKFTAKGYDKDISIYEEIYNEYYNTERLNNND